MSNGAEPNQGSPSAAPKGDPKPNQSPSGSEQSPDQTSTGVSIPKESFDTLQQTVATQGKILESLPNIIRDTVSSVLEATRPTPPPTVESDEPDPTEDEFMQSQVAGSKRIADKLFRARIKPLVPHLEQQADTLFDIQYDLERNKDPELFDRLKPHIDAYFAKNPNAKHIRGVVTAIVDQFAGRERKALIQEAVEKATATPVVEPDNSGGTGGPKPPPKERTTLSDDEKILAVRLGLSEEDMLASLKDDDARVSVKDNSGKGWL